MIDISFKIINLSLIFVFTSKHLSGNNVIINISWVNENSRHANLWRENYVVKLVMLVEKCLVISPVTQTYWSPDG